MKITIAFGVLILAAISLYSSAFIVPEGRQAIITQFGKPMGDPITKTGMHFKTPFIQEIRYVDKRILSWDGIPNQIPTKDKKYISVDTTARWIIVDVLKFIQTVQNERGAKARLDSILDANTRDIISRNNLVEAVRNSNSILDRIEAMKKIKKDKSKLVIDDEIFGEIENINLGREKLSDIITKKSDKELRPFGISIIDVQLRRISYEKKVEQKVYERMISERKRIAEKIRSIGKGEKAKIEGRLSKDLQTIESEAYKNAEIIKGLGEAKSTAIYARALSKDPSFYEFMRTLEAYKNVFDEKTNFILSSDSEFLKLLKKAN